MSEKKQNNHSSLLILAVVLLASVLVGLLLRQLLPAEPLGKPAPSTTEAIQTDPLETTQPNFSDPQVPQMEQEQINLGYGLQITDSGKYTGLYMEDGSNEVLENVMMIIVLNDGDQDIQLAEITAQCEGEEYTFTLTNLPVGTRTVLLDLDRKPYGGTVSSAVMQRVVVFEEPMALHEDVLELSGSDGVLNVKNISEADLDGDIYIYYKYAAQDIFYGGITFRVRVEGGLKAGELRQIPAGHFSPAGCTIVQVTIHE